MRRGAARPAAAHDPPEAPPPGRAAAVQAAARLAAEQPAALASWRDPRDAIDLLSLAARDRTATRRPGALLRAVVTFCERPAGGKLGP